MSYGYGGPYHDGISTQEIVKDVAREARTHYRTILDGGRIILWVNDTVIAQLDRDGETFRLSSTDGALHRLAISYTDAERLVTHVKGFVEIKLMSYGYPTSGVHFSLMY